jgi:hypothetical protein
MKLLPFRNAPPTEPRPIIRPLLNDAERPSGRGRALSIGTRVDLMFLSLWLIAAAVAAVGIVVFLVYSYLPTIARGG